MVDSKTYESSHYEVLFTTSYVLSLLCQNLLSIVIKHTALTMFFPFAYTHIQEGQPKICLIYCLCFWDGKKAKDSELNHSKT